MGILMNQSKEEHQVGFVGSGSVTSMRTLYKGGGWPEDMEQLCPTQRVLGTLLTHNCSFVAERQARLRAAVMGRVGSAECSLRVRRMTFRSLVWSTLLTGVGDTTTQLCRLQLTSSQLVRVAASCVERLVAAGSMQMRRNVTLFLQQQRS